MRKSKDPNGGTLVKKFNPREKRTLRRASGLLIVYLVAFFGWKVLGFLETKRGDYAEAKLSLLNVTSDILREQEKAKRLERLKENFKFDPKELSAETAVGEARAKIMHAAATCGVGVTKSREIQMQVSTKELGTIQIDGSGATLAVLRLLHGLKGLGYPLLIDRLQLDPMPKKPGIVHLALTVTLLNFEGWKPEEAHAGL